MDEQKKDANEYTYDVFLSYSTKDQEVVLKLAKRLREDGLRVWFDKWEMPFGANIKPEIVGGLKRSRFLVQNLSPNGLGSEWAEMERDTILINDPNNARGRFIPLLLADCEIPDDLQRFVYADYRQRSDTTYQQLLAHLRANAQNKTVAGHFIPSDSASEESAYRAAQSEFTRFVRIEISKVFSRRKTLLMLLVNCIVQVFTENQDSNSSEQLLIPDDEEFDIDATIVGFYRATGNCLQQLPDHRVSQAADIAKHATTVFGWLVLLAVSAKWLSKNPGLVNRLQGTDYIELPLEDDHMVEIVAARLREKPAKLGLLG